MKEVIKHPTMVISTANFQNCRKNNCLFQNECEKEHSRTKSVNCIHPEKQVIIDNKEIFNATGDTFLANLLAHFRGTATPNLEFTDIVLTTKATPPTGSSTLDSLQIGRKSVTNAGTNPTILSSCTFTTADALTKSTTVSGTPVAKNTFNVTSATGLAAGDLIDFTQSSPYPKKIDLEILSVVGSVVTLTQDLDAIPESGNILNQKIGRIYLVDASDNVISVFRYSRTKTSDQQIAITYSMTLKGS